VEHNAENKTSFQTPKQEVVDTPMVKVEKTSPSGKESPEPQTSPKNGPINKKGENYYWTSTRLLPSNIYLEGLKQRRDMKKNADETKSKLVVTSNDLQYPLSTNH